MGWLIISRAEDSNLNHNKKIIGFILIIMVLFCVFGLIHIFNFRGPAINWVIILCLILIILIGLQLITGLKILNAINSFFFSIWLILTPFKISILDDSIFFMIIIFLPIGLCGIMFGISQLMKDVY